MKTHRETGSASTSSPSPASAAARIAQRLLKSDVVFERGPLLAAAMAIAADEDPLSPHSTAAAAVDELIGMGPLEPLLADESVSDILVNGPNEIWVERSGGLEKVALRFSNAASVAAAVERAVAPLGLRLDHASPVVDARLPGGARIHAVLPPVAPDGPIVAIRRFTTAVNDLDEMVDAGSMTGAIADLLRSAVARRCNILVCGGTGTGKTTLLNVLSREIPCGERVVTIEDAAELSLTGHVVRLEARPPNSEGSGAVLMRDLVRHALRLRPDRIIVGEVRGGEALDMIQAMSTGHPGSMSTLHAEDAAEALWRLELLARSDDAATPATAIRALLRSALKLVVVMGRSGRRRIIQSVVEVTPDELVVLA